MFQITNYSKIVVAIRQQSNILGFLINVLTEKRPSEEEQAEFELQQSSVLSLEKRHKVVRLNDNSKTKNVNIDFESHPLFCFLHCHC